MQKIAISAGDHDLRSWHYPADRDVLAVVCHGFKGFASWGFFPHLCEELQVRGIPSLRFDFSHNGTGEDPEVFDRLDLFARQRFGREIDEIGAVTDWARGSGYRDVVVIGHSRGGGSALLSAAEKPVAGVVTLAGIDSVHRFDDATIDAWRRDGVIRILNGRTNQEMPMHLEILEEVEADPDRFDILTRASRLDAPCWHWHGTADPTVEPDAAHRLGKATGGPVMLLEGTDHVFDVGHPFVGPSPALTEVVKGIAALPCWA